MKQPIINIKESGKDWGEKRITALHWHRNIPDKLSLIEVDFYETGRDISFMYSDDGVNFYSSNKNLWGKITFK